MSIIGEINMLECCDKAGGPSHVEEDLSTTYGDCSSPTVVVPEDEPYLYQEFESEAAARAFYKAYAMRVGFMVRQSKLTRSKRDCSAIGRTLVCNKEGHRFYVKSEKIIRHRATTRVGCKAKLVIRKLNADKWIVSRFDKDHTHPLTPRRVDDQYLSVEDKMRALREEVFLQREQAETYKEHLDILFDQVEGLDNVLSKKIQEIVKNVKEMEAEEMKVHDRLNQIFP